MFNRKLEKSSDLKFSMYIDYDRFKQVFYHNFYFEENKCVFKIALTPPINKEGLVINDENKDIIGGDRFDLKIERFDLTKYVYLLYFD